MVLDIEKYPEFVPWCLDSKIHKTNKKNNIVEITADLTIGKSIFKETYKSFVIYNKFSDTIFVKFLLQGTMGQILDIFQYQEPF